MNQMSETTNNQLEVAWCVYGATRQTPNCLTTLVAVEPQFPVKAIFVEPFFVIASCVSLDEYDDPVLKERIQDVAWLEPRVRRHEAVNTQIFDEMAIIPMRFGTIFRTKESLISSFEAQRVILTEAFFRLDGKGEWTLKIFVSNEALSGYAASSDEPLRTAQTAMAALSPGVAFFQRKKLDALRESAFQNAKERLANEVVSAFEVASCQVRRRDTLNEARLAERPNDVLLVNAAVLALRSDSDRLVAVAESFVAAWEAFGIQADVALDGPWPPFRFIATN